MHRISNNETNLLSLSSKPLLVPSVLNFRIHYHSYTTSKNHCHVSIIQQLLSSSSLFQSYLTINIPVSPLN